ncbi:MAG: Flp family type IVb pilin [Blastocatellia bacterium]
MIKEFLKDESGQDIVEYSLLLVLIGAVAVLILTGMGTSISKIFNKITASLSEAESKVGAPPSN